MKSDVHPTHEFAPWQVWPGSYDNPPADGVYPMIPEPPFTITRSTRITSMGSCFAREIKQVLVREGYTYLTEEAHHPASKHAGAAWERVYNTFCMRQIFEYSFLGHRAALRWWKAPISGVVQDPYRRIILYDDVELAEADFLTHQECSRRVLETAEVLILTLGLTEVWRDKEDGWVISLPAGPYVNEGGDMNRYDFLVSRYTENLRNLETIYDIVKSANPSCKIILTVSPVQLWATFRKDCDVITAGGNSKATLRAVADEMTAHYPDVAYFPAYEMAMVYFPLLREAVFVSGRENFHVRSEVVEFIMRHFFAFFTPKDG